MPSSDLTNSYCYRAKITKVKGNCFDIEFQQDIGELNIKRGEQVPNVPMCLFRKDFDTKINGMGGEIGQTDDKAQSFLTRNAPYIT